MKYSTTKLLSMETIRSSHDSDLKFQNEDTRVWLSRGGKEDGEPYENTVYEESYIDGIWVLSGYYDSDSIS